MIGINDLLQMQYLEIIEKNFLKIFDKLAAVERVYICSLLPVEMMNDSSDINEKIILLNHFLKRTSRERGYIFVDLYSALAADDGGIQKALTSDGVHLTPQAYEIFEGILKDHLQ